MFDYLLTRILSCEGSGSSRSAWVWIFAFVPGSRYTGYEYNQTSQNCNKAHKKGSQLITMGSSLSSKQADIKNGLIWDRFADRYAKTPIADEEVYKKKLEVTQSYLRPEFSVVEVGCGTGGTALIHAPYVKHILATDVSEQMLKIANQKKQEASFNVENVDYHKASIGQLEIKDGSKDVVLALNILHLVESKEDSIRKIHAWLKPGGVFVTSTPCIAEMGRLTTFFVSAILPLGNKLGFLPHVVLFSKQNLKEDMIKAGFEIDYEWHPNDDPKKAVFIVATKK